MSRDGRVIGWQSDFERPSIGEPLRNEKDGQICEYLLRAGVLYSLEAAPTSREVAAADRIPALIVSCSR